MRIGNRLITNTSRPYFIADIAANHDGSLERAFKLIELAKEAGADVAKFQNFKADFIVSKNAFDSMERLTHQSKWAKSVYDTYKDASLSDDWNLKLKEKCDEVGIEYMTSPYDKESVDNTECLSNAIKIGSGDITWIEMLEYIAQKDKPVLLATGASDIEDVKRAYEHIRNYNTDIILMQCNTNYTASDKNFSYINLNVLKTYRVLFPDAVLGLSDHTYGSTTVLGALAIGATVFEKHFTDDNDRIGPDHKFSMNPQRWKEMVKEANLLYDAMGDGIKRIEDNESESAIVQRRALYYMRDLKRGEVIGVDDLFPLRPIKPDGISPLYKENLIGKVVNRDVNKSEYARWEDVE